jgi:glyoxylase-like metal-dependent hydrolase (beta-lactamase superfamily II)
MGVFQPLMAAPSVETDRILEGGEVLNVLGWPIEVLHAPGHTLGSCGFYARPAGILFAGDAVNGRSGRPEPPVLVEDPQAAVESYRKLTSLNPGVLCPGHGSLVRRPS